MLMVILILVVILMNSLETPEPKSHKSHGWLPDRDIPGLIPARLPLKLGVEMEQTGH